MSETLSIIKDNAIKAFNEGTDGDKALLIRLFPDQFVKKPIMERVTTLEEACAEKGIGTDILFANCVDDYEKAVKAIELFAEVLREGKNPKDCFYYPYFYSSSGGGFSYDVFSSVSGYSIVGARLRVDSSEKAKHLGKCMESYYKTYLLGE